NVSDAPFLLYKHFTHEGGIASPFIASWPSVIKANGSFSPQIGYVTDIMATCVELAGAHRPESVQGQKTPPLEGSSLLPIFEGKQRARPTAICWEHEGNRAVRLANWKLVSRHRKDWELYDMAADRTELHNLARQHPDQVRQMAALYDGWAKR